MKKQLAVAVALTASASVVDAATLFYEGFETDGNGSRYTTNIPEFSDGGFDFFTRTDGSNIDSAISVTGAEGDFWFHGMDLDGEGAALPLTLSFNGINIAGATNLAFSIMVAEDDAADGNEDWDIADSVLIEFQIDGNGFQNLMAFESIPDGDSFNAVPGVDFDFDGNGDLASLTDTFSTFLINSVLGTGSALDLRFTFNLNSGDEDIAFDAITVTGDVSPIPVPAAAWFMATALAGMAGIARRRK